MTSVSSGLREDLERILNAVTIESPRAFTLGGRRVQVDGRTERLPGLPAGKPPLLGALQAQLYIHFYCRPFSGAITEPPSTGDGGEDLTAALMAANAGQERWEPGWYVARVLGTGQIAVQRNGLSRLLWPGEFLSSEAGCSGRVFR